MMADPIQSFLPRFRYGMIQPRSHEGRQRGAGYQFYRLVPLDVMEFSSVLGIENYTLAAVEKALGNYWNCVNALASEKVDLIIIGGAPVSAALGRARMLDLIKQTKDKTGIAVDAPLEAMIAAMKHLGVSRLAVGSRWADQVNDALSQYLAEGGIEVVGCTKRNQWGAESAAMSLEDGLNMALEVGREAARMFPNAQAIAIPGGAALCLHVVPAVEAEFGKPAFTNLTAEIWNDLVRPGIIPPVKGWGKLLAMNER
jgi:arylmalonate decarboxylase